MTVATEQLQQVAEKIFDPDATYTLRELSLSSSKSAYTHPDRTLQIMDFTTAEELLQSAEQLEVIERIPVHEFFPTFIPPSVQETNRYIADRQWYADAKHEDSIHGKMHVTRVLLNVNILGQMMDLPDSDMDVLKVAAMVHDLQRVYDTPDTKHAIEGARWFRDNSYLLEERGIHLSEEQKVAVETIVAHHQDQNLTQVPKKYHMLFRVFQAADGADLYRTANEKWWPTPQRFDTLFEEIVARNPNIRRRERKATATLLRDKFLKMAAYSALISQHIQARYNEDGYTLDGLYAIQAVASELGTLQYDPKEILAAPISDTTSVATLVQEKSPQNFSEFTDAIVDAIRQVKEAHPDKEIWLVSGAVSGTSQNPDKDEREKENLKQREENEQRLKEITSQLQQEHPKRIYFTSAQIMSPRIRRLLTESIPSNLPKDEFEKQLYAAFVTTWGNVVLLAGNPEKRVLDGVLSVEGWERSTGAQAERKAAEKVHLKIEDYTPKKNPSPRERRWPLYVSALSLRRRMTVPPILL